ncbi:hypothetical protein CKA55_12925 [Arcobacter suis]|uniref:Type III restriction/modification system, modification subunit n=1 Tax=Arcobacter suis CECT 7833 TaxID=663365 RepID=A0AAD0WRB0_9BACT|nr:DEAD/DEAH box helicase family protein [Arcobacter suis]AXX90373.1 type III restriction/modification system, modification subunit [Arcobacter suis CECT 7833]RWS45419.1 hypothetical protein CKA55_12925 [Arcobacter suis]
MSNTISWENKLIDLEKVTLDEYLDYYKHQITQESEKLFISDFIYPLLGETFIKYLVPQYPFIDSEGKSRRLDFGLIYNNTKLAFEIDGETYHAEGAITSDMFDDSLFRQNEILSAGWKLLRFSFTQLQSDLWRKKVLDSIKYLIKKQEPTLLGNVSINPNYLQKEVLETLDACRKNNWKKGIVVLPTGTGKTYLSAFDTLKSDGKILFIVHRLDILKQAKNAFEEVYPNEKIGILTGEVKENLHNSKILFASKDSLNTSHILESFVHDYFDYIIVDEVHHGQAPSYKIILEYFQAKFFMLGLTATPDRMDRKDIFELFDYNKVFEYTLFDAINNGFLVPFNYYGLKDNIDYSKIKYNGARYNINDLNKYLIIPERNQRIYEEYIEKGKANKAVGFCCSIKHANAMAKFFNEKGIPSVSLTSESKNRDEVINKFTNNEIVVIFTVDLFNEGIDFPDLRVLLFLRPTESKTIFLQQLGRGLRLCNSKENVTVLDFITNYKKASKIRTYLSDGKSKEIRNGGNGRIEKIEYIYSPKCNVKFDAEVEEILDSQDLSFLDIEENDLIVAYYNLKESLKRKPTPDDINQFGEFKMSRYLSMFGSWGSFLKKINEHTEFSYHFPQGVDMRHVLYLLKNIGEKNFDSSYLAPKYIKFNGAYDSGSLGGFQRQTKYKLQALMELKIILDFRGSSLENEFIISFTEEGEKLYKIFENYLKEKSFTFSASEEISWDISTISGIESLNKINTEIFDFLKSDSKNLQYIRNLFLNMDALSLLLNYLYRVNRSKNIPKQTIYKSFFKHTEVKQFCEMNGLKEPTEDVIVRRVPFLFNLLESLGIIKQTTQEVEVLIFYATSSTLKFNQDEPLELTTERMKNLKDFIENRVNRFSDEDEIKLKTLFGKNFLTEDYYLKDYIFG